MKILSRHIVPENTEKKRIQEYAVNLFKEFPSKSGLKKAIKRGEILINNEVATTGRFIYPGQVIELTESDIGPKKVFKLVLPILYEDDYLAIINKPAGISVSGNYFRTIQNAIPFNISTSKQEDKLNTARPVHRLDRPTSGLLLIAKTQSSLLQLNKLFENKEIDKTYFAIVIGIPTPAPAGTITTAIENKEAITHYETVNTHVSKQYGMLSLLKLSPKTGRTHQLRIHLSGIGCPILGDKEYGIGRKSPGKGLFLCATGLSFTHPILGEPFNLTTELPGKFTRYTI